MRQDNRLRASDQERRIAGLIQYGRVIACDYDAARVTVQIDGRATAPLPFLAARAGDDRSWWPLSVGEQVAVLAPEGDLVNAIVLGALYSQAHPAPGARGDLARAVFGDGLTIEHDKAARRVRISYPDGTVVIDAKNLILRTGEEGYYHVDHAGRASRVTHKGDTQFEGETWAEGSEALPLPDKGFHPPAVHTQEEDE